MSKKLTTEEFIIKAKEKHGDLYKYDDVVYINNATKIQIFCSKCKKHFEQKPNDHISGKKGKGNGCPACFGNIKSTKEEFTLKAREKHNERYNYDGVIYINNKIKIKIFCNECKDYFEQTPNIHINGNKGKGCGCPVCSNEGNRSTDDEIISRLTIEEEPIVVDDQLRCRCAYCKEYFVPERQQLWNRITSLEGCHPGESRLYCSDSCKNLCPIFKKISYYKDQDKPDTTRPVQPELRRLVLERDNNQCQICGSSKDLHCHHITGVEINPVESADIDNCITLCYTCHSRAHSSGQCDVRRKPCKMV